tara:strand:+ start:846 stop:1043 length:198 start_codon:yes stop_codon:yes gene_type:complete
MTCDPNCVYLDRSENCKIKIGRDYGEIGCKSDNYRVCGIYRVKIEGLMLEEAKRRDVDVSELREE